MPNDTELDPTSPSPLPSTPTTSVDAPPAPEPVPSRTLGVVGFALSLVPLTNLVGLVLSVIALVKAKRAGASNGFALAGVIIGSIGVAITLLFLGLAVPTLIDAAQTCAQLGDGVHQVGQSTYTCTPTSFSVVRNFG
ncbi:hypothetical protein ASE14_08600 [Agromyces sp. Root81]|uniref:DUF4190 domain-containing protein n=1 Tax=Agromyces sp. Root81 TaxID=1736601 RepID=UPI0006FCCE82|nr:DUF4190 domain-containing protein [Agromyces sp. Root81]KRC61000.1 hypothetical protein ASE14_08600 [Agromyces sp. Root81]